MPNPGKLVSTHVEPCSSVTLTNLSCEEDSSRLVYPVLMSVRC